MLSIQRVVVIIAALGLGNVALSADPSHTTTTPSQNDKNGYNDQNGKNDKDDANRSGETMSDGQIANSLAMIDQAEIDAARYVANKSSNDDVKRLAQKREDDFSAALDKTQEWMKKNNVTQTTPSSAAGSASTPASGTSSMQGGSSSATTGAQYGASSQTPTSGGASNPSGTSAPNTSPDSYGAKTPQAGPNDPYGPNGQYGSNANSPGASAGQSGENPQYGSTGQTANGQTTGQQPPMNDQRQCPPGMYLAMDHCQPTTPQTSGQGNTYGSNSAQPVNPSTGTGDQGSSNPMPSNATPSTSNPSSATRTAAVPSDLGQAAQDELAQLRSLSGIELDRRYVAAAINDDQRLLDAMDTRFLVQAKDSGLKTLVKDTRSKVAANLDAARRVQTNMVDKPRTSGTAENDVADPNALKQ
jgi:predicted outer membrane protein